MENPRREKLKTIFNRNFWPESETKLENEFITMLLSCCDIRQSPKKCEAANDDKKCKMRLKFPFPVSKIPSKTFGVNTPTTSLRNSNKIDLEWRFTKINFASRVATATKNSCDFSVTHQQRCSQQSQNDDARRWRNFQGFWYWKQLFNHQTMLMGCELGFGIKILSS